MARFINENCIGCTLCTRSCPVGAISGKAKERQVINPAVCIDCGACGAVCANGAVENGEGIVCSPVPPARRLRPVIDGGKCTGCQLCIENCVINALALTDPQFKGDVHIVSSLVKEAACTGCSYCARVCPQHAIQMESRN